MCIYLIDRHAHKAQSFYTDRHCINIYPTVSHYYVELEKDLRSRRFGNCCRARLERVVYLFILFLYYNIEIPIVLY